MGFLQSGMHKNRIYRGKLLAWLLEAKEPFSLGRGAGWALQVGKGTLFSASPPAAAAGVIWSHLQKRGAPLTMAVQDGTPAGRGTSSASISP